MTKIQRVKVEGDGMDLNLTGAREGGRLIASVLIGAMCIVTQGCSVLFCVDDADGDGVCVPIDCDDSDAQIGACDESASPPSDSPSPTLGSTPTETETETETAVSPTPSATPIAPSPTQPYPTTPPASTPPAVTPSAAAGPLTPTPAPTPPPTPVPPSPTQPNPTTPPPSKTPAPTPSATPVPPTPTTLAPTPSATPVPPSPTPSTTPDSTTPQPHQPPYLGDAHNLISKGVAYGSFDVGGWSQFATLFGDVVGGDQVAADFNGDGYLDILVGADASSRAEVCLNNAGLSFTCSVLDPVTYPQSSLDPVRRAIAVEAADINNNGHLDVIIGRGSVASQADTLANGFCLNDGEGAFTCELMAAGPERNTRGSAAGDFDGDGNIDVVYANSVPGVANELCLGDGASAPSFACSDIGALGGQSFGWLADVATARLNDDDKLDLIFASDAAQDIVCMNNGSATFTCAPTRGGAAGNHTNGTVAAGDFNSDGHLDFVTTGGGVNDAEVCLSDGNEDPGFDCSLLQAGVRGVGSAVGDIDGLSGLDIVLGGGWTCLGDNEGGFDCNQDFSDAAHNGLILGDFEQMIEVP